MCIRRGDLRSPAGEHSSPLPYSQNILMRRSVIVLAFYFYPLTENLFLHLGQTTLCLPFAFGNLKVAEQEGHLRYTCVFLSRYLFFWSFIKLQKISFSRLLFWIFLENIRKSTVIISPSEISAHTRSNIQDCINIFSIVSRNINITYAISRQVPSLSVP